MDTMINGAIVTLYKAEANDSAIEGNGCGSSSGHVLVVLRLPGKERPDARGHLIGGHYSTFRGGTSRGTCRSRRGTSSASDFRDASADSGSRRRLRCPRGWP